MGHSTWPAWSVKYAHVDDGLYDVFCEGFSDGTRERVCVLHKSIIAPALNIDFSYFPPANASFLISVSVEMLIAHKLSQFANAFK